MERAPVVYILASARAGTLYIGVTSNLLQRLHQHREGLIPGFTSRYGVARLVWFEMHGDMASAIGREKQLKKWNRAWKLSLIEERNPHWEDLAVTMLGLDPLDTSSPSFPRKRESTDMRLQQDGLPSMDPRFRGDDEDLL
ncbi:GIY-YIG nuclease family protein [Sphingomonas sp. AP4-R1]|nr:GIY-YIG nuclease family protein [Sphingomonas sp. AP4-R1]